MNSNKTKKLDPQLKRVPMMIAVFGALFIAGIYYKTHDMGLTAGVVFGVLIAALNFVFLTKMIVNLFDDSYKRKGSIAVMFSLKLAFIAVILWIGFVEFELDLIGFAIGFGALIPAVLSLQFFSNPVAQN